MKTDRRRLLKGGSLAAFGAGFLSRFERAASAQGRPRMPRSNGPTRHPRESTRSRTVMGIRTFD